MEEITDAVYAMRKAIARLLNAKMGVPGIGRRLNREGNTREEVTQPDYATSDIAESSGKEGEKKE